MLPSELPNTNVRVLALAAVAVVIFVNIHEHSESRRQNGTATSVTHLGWPFKLIGIFICLTFVWLWRVGLDGLVGPGLRVAIVENSEQRRRTNRYIGSATVPRVAMRRFKVIVSNVSVEFSQTKSDCHSIDQVNECKHVQGDASSRIHFQAASMGVLSYLHSHPNKDIHGLVNAITKNTTAAAKWENFSNGENSILIPAPLDDTADQQQLVVVFQPNSPDCYLTLVVVINQRLSGSAKEQQTSSFHMMKIDKQYVLTLDNRLLELMSVFDSADASKEASSDIRCTICFDELCKTVLIPCRHRCVCDKCLAQIDGTCPICRSPILYLLDEVAGASESGPSLWNSVSTS